MKQRKKGKNPQRIPDANSVIGQNMRSLRLAAGMSLEVLAENLHVSYQQVQKYETGNNRLPLQYVPILCDVFGVPAEAFLNGLQNGGSKLDDDIAHVQFCIARVGDRKLRQKIVSVVDILAA
jgi:transcriptional regulator with XRE-family HTH domain